MAKMAAANNMLPQRENQNDPADGCMRERNQVRKAIALFCGREHGEY